MFEDFLFKSFSGKFPRCFKGFDVVFQSSQTPQQKLVLRKGIEKKSVKEIFLVSKAKIKLL